MTRDTKLALIFGFAIVLIVGLLISDHFAVGAQPADAGPGSTFAAATPLAREAAPPATKLLGTPIRDAPVDATAASSAASFLSAGDSSRGVGDSPMRDARDLSAPADRDRDDRRRAQRSTTDDDANDSDSLLRSIRERLQSSRPAAQTDIYASNELLNRGGDRDDDVPSLTMDDGFLDPTDPDSRVRTHTVQPGETLWGLAQRYYGDGSLHSTLGAFNEHLLEPDGDLPKGVRLRIPPRDLLRAGSRADAAPRRTVRDDADDREPRLSETRTYVVQKGDVLGTIAQRELGTATRWREVFELNRDRLDRPEDIWVGMKLKLPVE
jgi:nucleoid-associated protein YgaU